MAILSACTSTSPAESQKIISPTVEIVNDIDTSPQSLNPTPSPIPTVQPEPIAGTMVLEIDKVDTQTIYNQKERVSVGKGTPYFFWPDGNMAILLAGGEYRFFSPNGDRTAITHGTFDDPGASLEISKLDISGIDPQFPYAAGGSLYRDPDSGMLIMFYHAERHFGTGGRVFHAAIGLAVSNDDGKSFQDLGIILESNAKPDINASCCVDMGGAAFTIKDGKFLLYFTDRMENNENIHLAVATAPIAEVVEAARIGNISSWVKYYKNGQEPGISGRASPLERGNPDVNWVSASYNEYVKKFIIVLSYHPGNDVNDSSLYLISSDDGINWSPRIPLLTHCDCELTYPSIISAEGAPHSTGKQFYIYYITTPRGTSRWQNTNLNRLTVSLTGKQIEAPYFWEFKTGGVSTNINTGGGPDSTTEGWSAVNQLTSLHVKDGYLVMKSTGDDPYMVSPWLAVGAARYSKIEITMKVSAGDRAQLFFAPDEESLFTEKNSIRFALLGDGQFHTYSLDMKNLAGWQGIITQLRLDPVETTAQIEIDAIRFTN